MLSNFYIIYMIQRAFNFLAVEIYLLLTVVYFGNGDTESKTNWVQRNCGTPSVLDKEDYNVNEYPGILTSRSTNTRLMKRNLLGKFNMFHASTLNTTCTPFFVSGLEPSQIVPESSIFSSMFTSYIQAENNTETTTVNTMETVPTKQGKFRYFFNSKSSTTVERVPPTDLSVQKEELVSDDEVSMENDRQVTSKGIFNKVSSIDTKVSCKNSVTESKDSNTINYSQDSDSINEILQTTSTDQLSTELLFDDSPKITKNLFKMIFMKNKYGERNNNNNNTYNHTTVIYSHDVGETENILSDKWDYNYKMHNISSYEVGTECTISQIGVKLSTKQRVGKLHNNVKHNKNNLTITTSTSLLTLDSPHIDQSWSDPNDVYSKDIPEGNQHTTEMFPLSQPYFSQNFQLKHLFNFRKPGSTTCMPPEETKNDQGIITTLIKTNNGHRKSYNSLNMTMANDFEKAQSEQVNGYSIFLQMSTKQPIGTTFVRESNISFQDCKIIDTNRPLKQQKFNKICTVATKQNKTFQQENEQTEISHDMSTLESFTEMAQHLARLRKFKNVIKKYKKTKIKSNDELENQTQNYHIGVGVDYSITPVRSSIKSKLSTSSYLADNGIKLTGINKTTVHAARNSSDLSQTTVFRLCDTFFIKRPDGNRLSTSGGKIVETEEGNLFRWFVKPIPNTSAEDVQDNTTPTSEQNYHYETSEEAASSKPKSMNSTNEKTYIKHGRFKNMFNFFTSANINKTTLEFSSTPNGTDLDSANDSYGMETNIEEDAKKFGVSEYDKKTSTTSFNGNEIPLCTTRTHKIYPTQNKGRSRTLNNVYYPKAKYNHSSKGNTTNIKLDNNTHDWSHSPVSTHGMNHVLNNTVIIPADYLDYLESSGKIKKIDINESKDGIITKLTSGNIFTYVMKPLNTLINVFRDDSESNSTSHVRVNVKNHTLNESSTPSNSSIVSLSVSLTDKETNGDLTNMMHSENSSTIDVNRTSDVSREISEPKVGLFDLLVRGLYHCMVETFQEPRPRDVHFYLFTRKNSHVGEELFLDVGEHFPDNSTDLPQPVFEETLQAVKRKRLLEEFEPLETSLSTLTSRWFNLRAETKILVHGYLEDHQTDIMVNMKDAYLKKGSFNVILVDWSLISYNTCYPQVTRALRGVGGVLARLLDRLAEGGVSLATVHLVGFSMGAHVAGFAGTETLHGLVSRITGLDPALPNIPMEPEVSLDAGDAVFVDIIHSAVGYLGQPGPMGHVDFYPNSGSRQPGCDLASLGMCSHRRSALYFTESITSSLGFHSTACDSWADYRSGHCDPRAPSALMGEPCSNNASGKYYLSTGEREPFAISPEHVKVKKSLLLDFLYDVV